MHDIIEKIVEIDAKAKDIEAEGIKLKEQAQVEVENEKKRVSEERLAREEKHAQWENEIFDRVLGR